MNTLRTGTCLAFALLLGAGCTGSDPLGTPSQAPGAPTGEPTASPGPAATAAPATAAPEATGAPTQAAGTRAPDPQETDAPTVTWPPGGGATEAPGAGEPTAIPVVIGGPGDVPLVPPAPPPEAAPRARRRMDIDQLNAAIRRSTGGIGWTEVGADGVEVDLFDQLSLTLGKPDYVDATQEDLAPSLLFQKFLGDAARSVCRRLVEKERTQPAGDRVLMSLIGPEDDPVAHLDATEANLSALLLRFHGRSIPPGSEAMNPWTWLVQSTQHVTGGDDPARAWEAVCVALITHPDFYTY